MYSSFFLSTFSFTFSTDRNLLEITRLWSDPAEMLLSCDLLGMEGKGTKGRWHASASLLVLGQGGIGAPQSEGLADWRDSRVLGLSRVNISSCFVSCLALISGLA